MKNSEQNAKRWFKEAENTFRQAKNNLDGDAYNLVCFLAEQTAQKALKAVMYEDGARFINIHSISELVKEAVKDHPEFLEFAEQARKLDLYYLSTRYPDAVPEPAVPSELFDKKQAKEALEIAGTFLKASQKVISA